MASMKTMKFEKQSRELVKSRTHLCHVTKYQKAKGTQSKKIKKRKKMEGCNEMTSLRLFIWHWQMKHQLAENVFEHQVNQNPDLSTQPQSSIVMSSVCFK